MNDINPYFQRVNKVKKLQLSVCTKNSTAEEETNFRCRVDCRVGLGNAI